MKALMIGGTGTISEAVVERALAQGIEITLLNRGSHPERVPPGVRVLQAEARTAEADRLLRDERFDVVVDWICFTADQATADVRFWSGKTDHFVFISSASVYQKPPRTPWVTESTPTVNPFWSYSQHKIEAEQAFLQAWRDQGFPATIVRPSYTYGYRAIPAGLVSGRRPWALVARMRRGAPIVVHGDGSALWTMTHNTDFAVGLVGLFGEGAAIGQAFHITSDEVLSWDEIYHTIGRAAGVRPHLVHIPTDFIAKVVPELGPGLYGDKAVSLIFDNRKIKRAVPAFRATTTFAQGMRQAIAWFEADPDRRTDDPEWNATMDAIVAAYGAATGG